MSDFRLDGKAAIVTGATRGIGFAMAVALAEAGADIIGVSATIDVRGGAVREAVERSGRTFTPVQVDFADREAVEVASASLAQMGAEILVNNAGAISRSPATEFPIAEWDRVIEIDLNSQFIVTQAVARGMLTRGRGKIIFTASLLSFQGGINVVGYTAAKSAISGVTKALANEWASRGVTVNAIAPGYIATDNTEALRSDSARAQSILDRIPAGRWGEPGDIAGATVFLASAASDYVSGVTLPVDGGWLGR